MCEVRSLALCLAKFGLLASQIPHTFVLKTPLSLKFKVMQSQSTLYFRRFYIFSQTLRKAAMQGFYSLLVLYQTVDWAA